MAADRRDVQAAGARTAAPVRRLGRVERREQILTAATRAFVRAGGFAATSLDDVADEAGITRMILYRHFDSKTDLYQAVLDRACARVHAAATREGELGASSVPGMLAWAAEDPDAFRLLFHHAAREPEFRAEVDQVRAAMAAALYPHLAEAASSELWARWAAQLSTAVVVEGVMAWLDAGQPDPDQAADRILQVVSGIF